MDGVDLASADVLFLVLVRTLLVFPLPCWHAPFSYKVIWGSQDWGEPCIPASTKLTSRYLSFQCFGSLLYLLPQSSHLDVL